MRGSGGGGKRRLTASWSRVARQRSGGAAWPTAPATAAAARTHATATPPTTDATPSAFLVLSNNTDSTVFSPVGRATHDRLRSSGLKFEEMYSCSVVSSQHTVLHHSCAATIDGGALSPS